MLKYRRKLARDRHVFNVDLLDLLADQNANAMDRRLRELQALDHCIQRLSPEQRKLITACYAPGTTIKDVAGELGRSATGLYRNPKVRRRWFIQMERVCRWTPRPEKRISASKRGASG